MKLYEALKLLSGQQVKIGSKCGFIWCGTVGDETLTELDEEGVNAVKQMKFYRRQAQGLYEAAKKKRPWDIPRLEKRIEGYTDRIRTFVPFRDRKVIDVYRSLLGGMVLIIEGKENGAYWTAGECERKEKYTWKE